MGFELKEVRLQPVTVAGTSFELPGNSRVHQAAQFVKLGYLLPFVGYLEARQSSEDELSPSSSARSRSSMFRLLRATYKPVDGSVNDAVKTREAQEKEIFPGRRFDPSGRHSAVRKAQSSGKAENGPGAEAPDDDVLSAIARVDLVGSGNDLPPFMVTRRPPLK
jgi:hypothetical protein